MNKNDENSERLIEIFESLSDISITLVADFFGGDATFGGLLATLGLADLGVTVFAVGVVGEDEAGRQILQAFHEHRVSPSGIDKLKNYATPTSPGRELVHNEHPALLNLIEHARKFASASEGVYVCDHGIGAASPRVLNFIKSNGCLREKTVAARSLQRVADFEQLTAAVASEAEVEKAIGIEIADDPKKLAVAGKGIVDEMKLESLLTVSGDKILAFRRAHKPSSFRFGGMASAGTIDLLGAIFTAALATGAEVEDAAQLAVRVSEVLATRPVTEKRIRREQLLSAVAGVDASRVR